MTERARIALPLAFLLFIIPAGGNRVWAQESLTEDAPAGDSVEDLDTPMEAAFDIEKKEPPRFPRLKNKLTDLPPFFRDTKLLLKSRTYYFRRDNSDGSENEAWATMTAYKSGRFCGSVAQQRNTRGGKQ